jgi:hypothetical protein
MTQELVAAYERARAELTDKTLDMVQRETAFAWAGRALASYEFFRTTGDWRWLLDAHEYAHEALEHAALNPDPAVLDVIRPVLLGAAEMARYQHANPFSGLDG